MDKSHKQLILALHQIWNLGSYSLIPNIYAVNFIAHWPKGWNLKENSNGHDGIEKAIRRIRAAFPDWYEKVEDVIVCGDKVVTRYISTGTNKGKQGYFPGTGKKIEVAEISIYRIQNNLVAEQWCLADDLHMSRQLDLIK